MIDVPEFKVYGKTEYDTLQNSMTRYWDFNPGLLLSASLSGQTRII